MLPADRWSRRDFLRCAGVFAFVMSSGLTAGAIAERPVFFAWGQEDVTLGGLAWPFTDLPASTGEEPGERER